MMFLLVVWLGVIWFGGVGLLWFLGRVFVWVWGFMWLLFSGFSLGWLGLCLAGGWWVVGFWGCVFFVVLFLCM